MEELEITMEELFAYYDFLNDEEYNKEKYTDQELFVDTPTGLAPIQGLVKKQVNMIDVEFEGGNIKVADKHIFVLDDNREVFAEDATYVKTKEGIKKILNKTSIGKDIGYDIAIPKPHHYYTANGVLHHNTVGGISIAAHNVLKGKNVLFVTLEMPEEQIGLRVDANILDIRTHDFKTMAREEIAKQFNSVKPILGKMIIKEFAAGIFNTLMLESLINDLKNEHDISFDLIVIDYLTLMASSRTTLDKAGGTYSYYKLIAEELHGFSKTCPNNKNSTGLPVLTFAQLNRCIEENSLVESENGSQIPAKDLEIGSMLKGTSEAVRVINKSTEKQKGYRITTKSGKSLVVSANHRFPTKYGMMSINEGLKKGIQLSVS